MSEDVSRANGPSRDADGNVTFFTGSLCAELKDKESTTRAMLFQLSLSQAELLVVIMHSQSTVVLRRADRVELDFARLLADTGFMIQLAASGRSRS